MKTCLLCPNEIPATIKIDGKKRNLKNRKYCFECSPFGEHNTKVLDKESINITTKMCCKCKETKSIEMFYKKNNSNKLTSYCKQCNDALSLEMQRTRKKEAVEYKGGKCVVCGYSRYVGSLDFHHVNPETKDFAISKLKSYSLESIKSELDKCILVCKNCHSEIHGGIIKCPSVESNHGQTA